MKVHGKVGPTIARVSCIHIEIQSPSLKGNRITEWTKGQSPLWGQPIYPSASHCFQSTNQCATCKTLRERPRGRTKKVRYFINGWVKASKCSLARPDTVRIPRSVVLQICTFSGPIKRKLIFRWKCGRSMNDLFHGVFCERMCDDMTWASEAEMEILC